MIVSNFPAITIRKLRAGLWYGVGKMLGEGEWQEEGLQLRISSDMYCTANKRKPVKLRVRLQAVLTQE